MDGDARAANMAINTVSCSVAFFDFKYTGIGLGVYDSVSLGQLLGGDDWLDHSIAMCAGERKVLQEYWDAFKPFCDHKGVYYNWDLLVHHWEAALVDRLRFEASSGFEANKHWLEARVRHILQDRGWWEWLNRANEHNGACSRNFDQRKRDDKDDGGWVVAYR